MDVTLTGSGPNSNVEGQIDPTHQASRVNLRPTEWQPPGSVIGGHYQVGASTGTMAAGIASAAQVWQLRWADPAKLFILKKLFVQCATGTAFTTLFGAQLELIIGHGSTANGSGGAAITVSGNKLRSTMAASAFATSGELRVATTAALAAATGQTLESAAVAECMGAAFTTNTQSPMMPLYEERDMASHPLVLNSGDTLAVRTLNPGASGTWAATFTMMWVETVIY